MQMVPLVSLDYEGCNPSENIGTSKSGCDATTFTQNHDGQCFILNKAKKPTRQWAAWTRQEEEMFFNALRQFGKNFEKITKRVQSKNKDQVRHYYYRLVRRMNKLLGPGLCLDAKNSKDTNAAMLRWWSLLEKQSCKSSKLHLKPRRFKIFIETLENQLLKDRKKYKRRRLSQEENCLPTMTIVSNQGRPSVHDGPAVRLVLVDRQNIQQSNSTKEASVKRNINIGINRRTCKSDSLPAKIIRQRHKPATASTAAFKRWEKAAIAGVSLVADAAEHLERTAIDKGVDQVLGPISFDTTGRDVACRPAPSPNSIAENNAQTLVKLKLQLFPIDEGTRKALERDTHNPHLELTLSTRKKISSVLEHLTRKWGSSSVASGELMLLPYNAQSENLAGYMRWTQDSVLTAADVYALIGSPSVFRLRYGWFSNAELASTTFQEPLVSSGNISSLSLNVDDAKQQNKNPVRATTHSSDCHSKDRIGHDNKDQQVSGEKNIGAATSSSEIPDEINIRVGMNADSTLPESSVFCEGSKISDGATLRRCSSKDDMQLRNGHLLSPGEWADSLTNISVGDLLSEVSLNIDNGIDPLPRGSSQSPQHGPFSCDSFDAAIAAHIHRHQNKTNFPSDFGSSIWEAEETCDAFSFQNSVPQHEVQGTFTIASSDACQKIGAMNLTGFGTNVKESLEVEGPTDDGPFVKESMRECTLDEETEDDNSAYGSAMDKCQSDPFVVENASRNSNGLTDLYWPESLGPLDLDIPASKYRNPDLILSDSLSGFSRLLGDSFDAFQSCSFFGYDKKETVEGKDATSLSDYQISNGFTDFARA